MGSNSTFLDSLCGPVSSFWRDLDDPAKGYDEIDFTLCFQGTIFLSLPCILFVLAFLFQILYYNKTNFRITINYKNVSKFLLVCLLTALSSAELLYSVLLLILLPNSIAPFQIYAPLIAAVSFLFCLFLIHYHRIRGIYTAGVFHVLWIALILYDVMRIRTYSLEIEGKQTSAPSSYYFYLSIGCVNLLFRSILLVITLLPDTIPDSWFKGIDKPIPEERATFLSQITWWWMNGLIWRGYRRALDRTDLWSLPRSELTATCAPAFRNIWENEYQARLKKSAKQLNLNADEDVLLGTIQATEKSPLIQSVPTDTNTQNSHKKNPLFINCVWIMIRAYWLPFLISAVLRLCNDTLLFVSPQLLKLMISFVQNTDEPYWHGIVYALLLISVSIIQSIFFHQHFDVVFRLGMNIRCSLISMIYRKSLRLSAEGKQKCATGEVVNLMSVDSQRFMDLTTFINYLWSAPYQAILSIIFLYFSIQYAVFSGLIVMVLLIPINSVLAAINRKIQAKQMELKDKRIKIMTEILNGIKVIKLYAWESPHTAEILSIREQEMRMLKYSAILSAISNFLFQTAPLVVSLVSFATYVLAGNELTAEVAFVALSLFSILRIPLGVLPWTISMVVECSVSVTRLNKFLNLEELDKNSVNWSPTSVNGQPAISLTNAVYSWQKSGQPILKNLNLKVPQGSLLSVIGQVGSGKTSFLMAMLGEMERQRGDARLQGSIAFVPQIAWMQNETLKNNILFGAPEDPHRYRDVLRACALESDIKILPTGDQTEIGEKGINLSGGQKQRVSLARAIYQDADVYFLDDTLSAVDAHVGQHIYQEVIGPNGLLKNKTRIFVTHNLNYVSDSDYIVMFDHGAISDEGSYDAIMNSNGHISQLIRQFVTTGKHDESPIEAAATKLPIGMEEEEREAKTDTNKGEKEGGIISEETVESGGVQLKVALAYVRSIGVVISVCILLAYVVSYIANGGTSLWLANWSNQYNTEQNTTRNSTNRTSVDVAFYLGIYAGLGFVQGSFTIVSSYLLAIGAIFASRYLHRILLLNVLRCPLSFFDKTPIGRILNRFSKDIYLIDETIPRSISSFLNAFFSIILVIFIVVYATPLFLTVIIPMAIFYFVVQRIYVCTSRQLKRLESISRSPIFSHFQESLSGASSIRAYKRQNDFILQNESQLDYNNEAYYPSLCANRWLGLRLEIVGHFVVFFAAIFAVVSRQLSITNAGLIGLSISYALSVTSVLNWLVRMTSELETNIVSVERVKEYAELETEASPVTTKVNLPADWPKQGVVQFNSYSVRYRKDLDPVIDKLDLEIKGGQKLAIVGRTGAGKSSLTLALFRILEADGGSIVIDGVNIADVGLDDLRSRVTIIPQDPVLFSGTLRSNLDPFGELISSIISFFNSLLTIRYHFYKEFDISFQSVNQITKKFSFTIIIVGVGFKPNMLLMFITYAGSIYPVKYLILTSKGHFSL